MVLPLQIYRLISPSEFGFQFEVVPVHFELNLHGLHLKIKSDV